MKKELGSLSSMSKLIRCRELQKPRHTRKLRVREPEDLSTTLAYGDSVATTQDAFYLGAHVLLGTEELQSHLCIYLMGTCHCFLATPIGDRDNRFMLRAILNLGS